MILMPGTMTKDDFIAFLEAEFLGRTKHARRFAEKQIQEKSVSVDPDLFREWLQAEQAVASQTPELKVFDLVLRDTPNGYTQALAAFIEFDYRVRGWAIDWQEQHDNAFLLLSGETLEGWRYGRNLLLYVRALEAQERVKAFSEGSAALTLLLRWQSSV